jgi:DNA-binding MarR family transcriptional regulator
MGAVAADEPLARLLAMALSAVVDELHRRLEERGWERTRPLWGFVLLALRDQPRNISQIGPLLGTTKQAAAKVVAGLEEAGLVTRDTDARDRRATAICLTRRGRRFLADVERIYEEIEAEWAAAIGDRQLAAVRTGLAAAITAHYGAERPPVRPAL